MLDSPVLALLPSNNLLPNLHRKPVVASFSHEVLNVGSDVIIIQLKGITQVQLNLAYNPINQECSFIAPLPLYSSSFSLMLDSPVLALLPSNNLLPNLHRKPVVASFSHEVLNVGSDVIIIQLKGIYHASAIKSGV